MYIICWASCTFQVWERLIEARLKQSRSERDRDPRAQQPGLWLWCCCAPSRMRDPFMHMVQDWKECWRHALGGTSISLMILFLLGPNLWVLWWERPASLDRRTRPWLGFFLMLVVLAPPLFIYFVSCKFKISSYVEVCVPFKSSSLH